METKSLGEDALQGLLAEAIRRTARESQTPPIRVRTYAETGMNLLRGLIVSVSDSEYDVTIMRRR